jgi:hypothetical protein
VAEAPTCGEPRESPPGADAESAAAGLSQSGRSAVGSGAAWGSSVELFRSPSTACRRRRLLECAGSRRAKASCHTSSSIRIASGGTVAFTRGIWGVLFLLLTGLADGLAPEKWRYAQSATRPNRLGPPLPSLAGCGNSAYVGCGMLTTGDDIASATHARKLRQASRRPHPSTCDTNPEPPDARPAPRPAPRREPTPDRRPGPRTGPRPEPAGPG